MAKSFLARTSSNSIHVLAGGSGRYILHDQPEFVIDAILGIVEEVRP